MGEKIFGKGVKFKGIIYVHIPSSWDLKDRDFVKRSRSCLVFLRQFFILWMWCVRDFFCKNYFRFARFSIRLTHPKKKRKIPEWCFIIWNHPSSPACSTSRVTEDVWTSKKRVCRILPLFFCYLTSMLIKLQQDIFFAYFIAEVFCTSEYIRHIILSILHRM